MTHRTVIQKKNHANLYTKLMLKKIPSKYLKPSEGSLHNFIILLLNWNGDKELGR